MKRIYKYKLDVETQMPQGSKIIRFGDQGGSLHVWAEVDTEKPLEVRNFWIAPTGVNIPDGWEWIATCEQGPFIWHLCEKKS